MRLWTGDTGSRVDDDVFAAFGLLAPDLPERSIEVWPENEAAVNVFIAMGTQWQVAGMGGITGLRYESLPSVMRFCGVKPAERGTVFHQVRVMESAILEKVNHGG